jgi:hypothetical protein
MIVQVSSYGSFALTYKVDHSAKPGEVIETW